MRTHPFVTSSVARNGDTGDTGVLGEALEINVLERGAVSELLLTPRFSESRPRTARQATQLASSQGVRTTIVTGLAAFELDLAADVIGAVLCRDVRRGFQSRAR